MGIYFIFEGVSYYVIQLNGGGIANLIRWKINFGATVAQLSAVPNKIVTITNSNSNYNSCKYTSLKYALVFKVGYRYFTLLLSQGNTFAVPLCSENTVYFYAPSI